MSQSASRLARVDARVLLATFVVLIFMIPAQLVVGPLGAAGTPAQLLGMSMLGWWLFARGYGDSGCARLSRSLTVPLTVFAVSLALAYMAGMNRAIPDVEVRAADRSLMSLAAWCGITVVAASGIADRAQLDRLLKLVAITGGAVAVVGICQFFGWNPVEGFAIPGLVNNGGFGELGSRSYFPRVQGMTLHPIEFGVVMCMIAPLTVHYALCADAGRRRVAWWALTVVIAFAIPLAVARSAILAATIVGLIVFPTWPRLYRRRVLLMAPFALVALKFLVPGLLGAVRAMFTGIANDPSTQGRTADYDAVSYFFSQAPLFGRGPGTLIPTMYRTLDNQYLLTLVTGGIGGLVGLVVLLTGGLLVGLIAWWRCAGVDRRLAVSLVAGILACAATCATFDFLSFPTCTGLLFLYLGAAGALMRMAPPRPPPQILVEAPALPAWVAARRDRLARAGRVVRLLLAVGIVASFGLAAALGGEAREYRSSGAVILNPSDFPGNPYVYGADVLVLSQTVRTILLDAHTRAHVAAGGADAPYEVAIGIGSLEPQTDREGLGPVIRFEARGTTPKQAVRTRDAVAAEVAAALERLQAPTGAARSSWVVALPVVMSAEPQVVTGRRSRGLFVGAALTLLAVVMLLRPRTRRTPFFDDGSTRDDAHSVTDA